MFIAVAIWQSWQSDLLPMDFYDVDIDRAVIYFGEKFSGIAGSHRVH